MSHKPNAHYNKRIGYGVHKSRGKPYEWLTDRTHPLYTQKGEKLMRGWKAYLRRTAMKYLVDRNRQRATYRRYTSQQRNRQYLRNNKYIWDGDKYVQRAHYAQRHIDYARNPEDLAVLGGLEREETMASMAAGEEGYEDLPRASNMDMITEAEIAAEGNRIANEIANQAIMLTPEQQDQASKRQRLEEPETDSQLDFDL